MPNNLPSPNQILGNNSRTPNQPVENNSNLPNPNEVLGKSALKKKEVSQSTQKQKATSLDGSNKATKQQSVSSNQQGNYSLPGEYLDYPGKGIRRYYDGKWYDYGFTETKNGKDFSVYNKDITDPNRITTLNKKFNKTASLDPIDKVYSNYDEEKKDNQYRINNGNWERKVPGAMSWSTVTNEGSVGALNRRYGKDIKYKPELKTVKQEPKLQFADINTSLVSKTEENAVDVLAKKYSKYGFTFEQTGFGTDYVTVYNKDKSKELTVGFDEKNPEEALKLRNFLEQNASKEKSNTAIELENKIKTLNSGFINFDEANKTKNFIIRPETVKYVLSDDYKDKFSNLSFDEMTEQINKSIKPSLGIKDLEKFYNSETYKIYKNKKKEEFGARDARIDLLYTELQSAKASGNKAAQKNIKSKITAFLTDDVIQDQVKNYSMQLNDLDNAAKKLANDQKKYAQSIETFNKKSQSGQMSQEEFDQTKKMLDEQAESLSTRADFLMSSGKSIQKNQKKLNVIAGKYVTEKAKAGSFGGGIVNSFLTGFSKAIVEAPATLAISVQGAQASDDYDKLSPEEKQFYKNKGYSREQTENLLVNERLKDFKSESRKVLVDAIGADQTTKEYMKSADRGFFEKAIYGVAESTPAMLLSLINPTASFTGLAAQSYSSIEDEMLDDPDFATSSVGERAIISVPYSLVMGVLENYGLKNVVKGESFAGGVVKNILAKSISKMPKNATREVLQSIIDKEVKSLIGKGLLRIANGAIAEFETGATQSLVLDVGLKSLYNKVKQSGMTEEEVQNLSGGEFFATPDTAGDVFSTVLEDGLAEAIGGATIGTFSTVASGLKNGNISLYDEKDLDYLKEISQDSEFKKLIVSNLKTEMLKGNLTKSEAQERLDAMNELTSVMESIPEELNAQDQIDAVNMLSEKNRLTREIQGKDPALVTAQTERINEINEELKTISKNAVQVETTGEVPVQPEATVGREMEEGKPQAEPQVVTEEGQATAKEEVKVFEFNGKKYEVTNESTTDLETGNLVPIDLATQIRKEGTPIEETVVVEPITKQEQKQNLVTEENVEQLRAQQTTPVAQKIFTTAKLAMKALPGVKIYVHNTTNEFDQAIGQKSDEGAKGAYVDGEVHINLENGADVVTMLHESLHHGLVVKGVKSGAMLDLAKGLKSVVSDKGLKERLDNFISGYDASEQAEEYVAELGAIMAEAQQELSTTKFQQFKNLINKIAQKIGLPVVFAASANAKNAVDFMNSLTKSVRTGQEIYATDPGDGGEVGTFNIPSTKFQKAKSVADDPRDFIRELVEDADLREFNGKKFVTNMYDYTNAGVTDLGNGFKINMLGGKNYVPLMMSLNGKKMGDVSNLAAFNTKAQAETFIRNAQMGGAELFAPHSGTLSQSWQFQQHTFAELFNLVLDNGILTPKQLIDTFNNAIKGNKSNQEEFAVFAKKYGENIENFDSFELNPKKIIELLDIKNNYSPNLRKALNNSISANKEFQKAIGVSNKEEFYKRIMDPLNQGMTGGEIMNVVKFDPNTFEIVQTKESDVDHHPSFGWTLLAKINGIYQPTSLYKSSNVTESYTKYNKDGVEVSRKAEEPKFEQKNVSSSAGAIPKVAEFKGESKPKFQKIAPNGKPSNLNDKQWEQVRTPEFKKWFGDWENDPANASKVVDENGEPLVVYHGTRESFDEFSSEVRPRNFRQEAVNYSFWFTSNEKNSELYGNQVMEVFLNSRNPLEIDYTNPESYREIVVPADKPRAMSIAEFNEKKGMIKHSEMTKGIELRMREDSTIDGIIHRNIKDIILSDNFQAFEPNQIKSATENVGTFSADTRNIKFQKANTQQEAIQKAKDKYTLSVEERGNPHKQGVDAALNDLRKSDWYKTTDDTQRENAERELKAFFGEKLKKAPSVAKILGKPKPKKVTVNEMTAYKNELRLQAKAARDAKGDLNAKRKALAAAISGMVKTGKIKTTQAAVLIKRISNLNLDNPVMVERFVDYASKVFDRADYQQRLDDAFSVRKSIRKLLKTDNQAEVSGMAKEFTKIDPSLVDDIDAYIEMAEKVANAVKPSRVKGLDVVMKEAANIAEISEYTSQEITRQEDIQIQELLAIHDYLEDISKDMSLKEIQDIINLLKEKPNEIVDKEAKVKEFLKNRFDFMAGIIDTMFKTGVDPMTSEKIAFDEKQKDLMKRVLNIDLNEMSTREAIKIVEGVDNFINNQITSGLESAVSSYEGAMNVKSFVARGKSAKPLRLFGAKWVGRFYSEQLFSLPMLMEKMFGGVTNSIDIMRKMGLLNVINGVNKANRQHSDIIDDFAKQDFAKGKDFMDAENIYEVGMLAELKRNLVGNKAEMQAEFNRRVEMLKDSIDLLIEEGNDKEKKMGELYKKVYDKLNVESMDMDVINANASKNNLEAVNWWINEWSKHRSELFDVSLSVYNTMLTADLNYTPDVLKTLSDKDTGLDESIVKPNGAFSGALDNIDKNKSGVLMETVRKRPSNRYISLDFYNNNSKALKAALTDINTAAAIRQVDGFLSSKSFNKLVPEARDRALLQRRISTYIKRAKGKNTVPRDTIEYLNKFVNFVTALGVGKALAGFNQTIMQTAPVILNTLSNAGRFDFVDADFNAWLNESGMPISNRGLESQSTIEAIDKKLDAKGQTTEQILKGVAKVNQWWLRQLLVKPDVWVARSSFKSYYLQNLKRRGISTDIDWKNHKIDKEAAEYAQIMIDRQQNISDPMLAGEFLASEEPMRQIARKIFIPFASFILNQKARMYNDMMTITSKTASREDKSIAARSMFGLAAELTAYQMIGFGIRRFYDMIAASLLGDEDDEEIKRKKLINATKYPLKSIVNDIISPVPLTDDLVTIGLNQALAQYPWMSDKEIKDAVEERNRILELKGDYPMDAKAEEEYINKIKEEALYQVYLDDNERKYGMIGIAGETYKEVAEISELYATGEFIDEYKGRETKKKLLEADRKDVGIAVLPMIFYSTGLLTKDVGSIGRNYVNRIKKKAITEKQYERYDAVQKELGRNLKSWEIELVKGKKESETAISEIEFIDRRGGLTERQGREYLKVMKAIGEPSVIDLIKIQEGQTADQILK